MASIRWTHAVLTDVGRVRSDNEDAYLAEPGRGAFAVADGMGGHAAGEVASAIAVRELSRTLPASTAELDSARLEELLERAIRKANRAIVREGRDDPERAGMGTTVTALVLLPDGRWRLGHVGDSRAYRLRGGGLDRLTEDHTMVEELVRDGRLTDEQARVHPGSSVLTRALGVETEVSVACYGGDALPGDRFLVTSDGLTAMLPEARLEELLGGADDPGSAARALVEAANEAGGSDNITVVVVDVEDRQG